MGFRMKHVRSPDLKLIWTLATETTMRLFVLTALAITTFAATMTFEPSDANAVVYCASGVVRAGCVVRPVVAPVARAAVVRPGVPGNRGGPVNRVGRR